MINRVSSCGLKIRHRKRASSPLLKIPIASMLAMITVIIGTREGPPRTGWELRPRKMPARTTRLTGAYVTLIAIITSDRKSRWIPIGHLVSFAHLYLSSFSLSLLISYYLLIYLWSLTHLNFNGTLVVAQLILYLLKRDVSHLNNNNMRILFIPEKT